MAWVVGDAGCEGLAGDAPGDVAGEGGVGGDGGGHGVGAAGDGLVDGVACDALVGVVDDGFGCGPLPLLVPGIVDGSGLLVHLSWWRWLPLVSEVAAGDVDGGRLLLVMVLLMPLVWVVV